MKAKKLVAFLLSAAMVAGALAGCGGDKKAASENKGADLSKGEEPEGATGETYTDEDGNTYAKFDDVKLKMLVCWNGDFLTADDQYNNEVAKAIRDKIGVTVEFEGIMMNEAEKLNMMFASGDMPDMVNAPYWGGTAGETAIIKKGGVEGRLIDIKDIVPNYPNIADGWELGVVSQKYLENDIDDPQFEGARYVLPTEVAGSKEDIALWAYGVFVRGDVAETLGVDVSTIKTSEQLYDFMKQAQEYGFKDVNGNDCIVATTYHDGWSYGDYAESFHDKNLTSYRQDENGNVTHTKLRERWIDENMFIWKLVNEGLLDKECFRTSDDAAKEKVGSGTALFTCAQYGVTIDATKQSGLYNSNPEMRYIPVGPLNYADGSSLVQIEPEGRSGSPVIFFPNTCSNIDAAMTWLDYVNSKEGQKLIYYGFEGDTYELNEEGQPRMNAELTERYAADSESVRKELRQRGINYMGARTYVASKRMMWFGESEPFASDALAPELVEYKKQRPAEILPGYAIDALAPGFEGYQEMAEWALDDNKEKEYKERAYFAETEEEAREILEEYQEYLRTNEDGVFLEFLEYMTEQAKTKDNIAY
ncbi:MAG: extracellular solute-binding protein [Clostridiales bacterium]|nr:extracellular solute-binding protein [Clostridiales bacterium]